MTLQQWKNGEQGTQRRGSVGFRLFLISFQKKLDRRAGHDTIGSEAIVTSVFSQFYGGHPCKIRRTDEAREPPFRSLRRRDAFHPGARTRTAIFVLPRLAPHVSGTGDNECPEEGLSLIESDTLVVMNRVALSIEQEALVLSL